MKKVIPGLLLMIMIACTLAGCACKHQYGDWEVKKEASCSEAGLEERTCSECGQTESREIPMTEHTYGDWEVTKAATCQEKGKETATCTVCGATDTRETELADHTYGDWEVTKAATCQEKGEETATCTVCGATDTRETELGAHTYGDWKTTKAATCTEAGSKTRTCTVCGKEETDSIAAAGHNYTKKVTKAATCKQEGVTKFTCSVCQNSYEEKIPALGHDWKSATCTSAKKCSRCGATEGKALGHSKGSDGKCTRCGEKMTIDMRTVIGAPTDEFEILRGRDSVGLVTLDWTAENNSGKTIKYYTVTCYYYNAVGDPAMNDITGQPFYTVKYVGPVEPKQILLVDTIGYCSICRSVVVGEITLEYTDGTSDSGWYGYKITI